MSKKKYYDEHGNQIRSRPEKPIYKKVSFWLIVILSITAGAVGMYILTNDDEVTDETIKEDEELEETESVDTEEEKAEEESYTYDDFKGIYVTFEGETYNSPIGM